MKAFVFYDHPDNKPDFVTEWPKAQNPNDGSVGFCILASGESERVYMGDMFLVQGDKVFLMYCKQIEVSGASKAVNKLITEING